MQQTVGTADERASAEVRGADVEPYDRDTLPRVFLGAVDRFGPAEAFRYKEGGAWRSLTHDDVFDRVSRLAAALRARGAGPGERVALLAENRPEWPMTDFATTCIGAVTVPVYPSLPAEQVAAILADATPRVAVVSSPAQLEKVRSIRDRVPSLSHLLLMDGDGRAAAGAPDDERDGLVVDGWAAALETPADPAFRGAALQVSAEDTATLIYTSGTTGVPKGAELSHGAMAYMVAATGQHGPVPAGAGDVALSILPLSHVLERAAVNYFWDRGLAIAFAESIDAVSENLLEVRPDVMVSVPRLFEKIYAKVVDSGGLKGRLARWAVAVGGRVVDARLGGGRPSLMDRARFALADRLVFRVLRQRTGGRLRSFISGGAPLGPEVARFFFAAGMPIYEGYGLTETAPVLACNEPCGVRLGTVGRPYPGVELRIGADGEVLARTPGLMRGYWGRAEGEGPVDADGWFHTGDIGELDPDGYLRITDRLKDIIVTAGGKNVAPQPVEQHAARSPYVAQAVLIGDRRPFPVLLVVPDWEKVGPWAAEHGVDVADREAAAEHPRLAALLEAETIGRMRGFARHETPKRVAVLPSEFTVEDGLLTPTLKTRRRQIEEAYRDTIERLYDDAVHRRRVPGR